MAGCSTIGQEREDRLQSFTLGGAGLHHRNPQTLGQTLPVQQTAPAAQVIGHVQDDQGGDFQSQDGGCQAQVAVQIGGIDYQQDGVRPRQARHLAQQHPSCRALVFRTGRQTVDARQIHQGDFTARIHPDLAQALFDRDPRIIGHLLPEPGEPVEERRFSAIGSSHHGHQGIGAGTCRFSGRGLRRPQQPGVQTSSSSSPAWAECLNIRHRAVPRLSATSEPSTRKIMGSPPGAGRQAVTRTPGRKPSSISRCATSPATSRRSRTPSSPCLKSDSVLTRISHQWQETSALNPRRGTNDKKYPRRTTKGHEEKPKEKRFREPLQPARRRWCRELSARVRQARAILHRKTFPPRRSVVLRTTASPWGGDWWVFSRVGECGADHSRKNGRSLMKANHEWTRINTNRPEDRGPPSTTSGTKMVLQFCDLGVTVSWDDGSPGARVSRPHKAWHSLGRLPHSDQAATVPWLSFGLADAVPADRVAACSIALKLSGGQRDRVRAGRPRSQGVPFRWCGSGYLAVSFSECRGAPFGKLRFARERGWAGVCLWVLRESRFREDAPIEARTRIVLFRTQREPAVSHERLQ